MVPGMYQPRLFSFFPLSSHWWITGGFSHLYETVNNGLTWDEITPLITLFTKFHAPVNWLGFGVGNLGYVIRYYDSTYVPVELFLFEGKIENNKIILNWKTATELNNMGFNIEKSFDKEIWFDIGFVEGSGTTMNPNIYSFIDNQITSDIQFYRLKQIDYDGSFEYSNIIDVEVGTPSDFFLSQNYPNPFNPLTTINYSIAKQGIVSLKIYDILGNEIMTLVNEVKPSGNYSAQFNASALASGMYIYKLQSGDFVKARKMILIK
jgi:hypothetical protein